MAKSLHIPVIALTSKAFSSAQPSRHKSGKRLFEVADYVLDNLAEFGDAAVSLPLSGQKTGPTSTVVGVALLHTILTEVAERLSASGKPVPIYTSANMDGGEEANRHWMEQYKEQLNYLL
jgi:uncharacterized phosphosugar-binding protein